MVVKTEKCDKIMCSDEEYSNNIIIMCVRTYTLVIICRRVCKISLAVLTRDDHGSSKSIVFYTDESRRCSMLRPMRAKTATRTWYNIAHNK